MHVLTVHLQWSEVFSDDMFETRFLKEGIMSPQTGADYRRCILDVGGTKVSSVLIISL